MRLPSVALGLSYPNFQPSAGHCVIMSLFLRRMHLKRQIYLEDAGSERGDFAKSYRASGSLGLELSLACSIERREMVAVSLI
jgi:hypothetical protein